MEKRNSFETGTEPYIEINGNEPDFPEEEWSEKSGYFRTEQEAEEDGYRKAKR